jgi:hypothetical protein
MRTNAVRLCFVSVCIGVMLPACALLPAERNTPAITGWSSNGTPQTEATAAAPADAATASPVGLNSVASSELAAPSAAGPSAAAAVVADPAEIRACRELAQTRMTDAAWTQSLHLDEADLRQVYAHTYDNCLHWHKI